MKSKEKILSKQYELAIYYDNGHLTKGDILSAMQEYSEQENARLLKIEEKQDQLIQNFKDLCKFQQIHDTESALEVSKKANVIISELEALKGE